jgi:DNA polymerase III subunit beta
MELTLSREQLLTPLNQIIGAVERKMTFPILANIKIEAKDNTLILTGTDLEVELQSSSQLEQSFSEPAAITLPGKKLAEICKMLPEQAPVTLKLQGNQMHISSAKSRFKLTTLPVAEFPCVAMSTDNSQRFSLTYAQLHTLIQRTHFAMAQQDVRYFLNGLLLDFDGKNFLQAVATDGHRLATNTISLQESESCSPWQVIIPRKTVAELMRLITPDETTLRVQLTDNHICFSSDFFTLTSKLIDGSFPDYKKVLPKNCDKTVHIDRDLLKQSLIRASILSSEKHRSIVLSLQENELKITANNPDQEEATETLSIDYSQEPLEIAFNVNYLLNILSAIAPGDVALSFHSSESSVLITEAGEDSNSVYVIMPMRI